MTENLATRISAIIEKSMKEEAYPHGTLHRMALRLRRLGNIDLAQGVENFAFACTPELEFFRTIAGMPAQSTNMDKLKRFQGFVRTRLSDAMLKNVSFDSPFELIEGVAAPDNDRSNQLSGPFFIALAGDFSEGHEWFPQNRSYLFTPAQNTDAQKADEFELRVLSDNEFKTHVIGEQGKDFRYKISLFMKSNKQGNIQELFEAAVEDIAKFSFGPKSSVTARDAFARAVEGYSPLTRVTKQHASLEALGTNTVPLALARTPSQ